MNLRESEETLSISEEVSGIDDEHLIKSIQDGLSAFDLLLTNGEVDGTAIMIENDFGFYWEVIDNNGNVLGYYTEDAFFIADPGYFGEPGESHD